MNIYEDDKYPWLTLEKHFIEEAIKKHKIVIGICLGSQLIAEYKNKVMESYISRGKEVDCVHLIKGTHMSYSEISFWIAQ